MVPGVGEGVGEEGDGVHACVLHAAGGEGRFEQQVAGYFTVNETFDVGCDTVSPVSDLYQSPFAFTGTILRVMVDITEASFEDLAAQHEMHARLAMATQ